MTPQVPVPLGLAVLVVADCGVQLGGFAVWHQAPQVVDQLAGAICGYEERRTGVAEEHRDVVGLDENGPNDEAARRVMNRHGQRQRQPPSSCGTNDVRSPPPEERVGQSLEPAHWLVFPMQREAALDFEGSETNVPLQVVPRRPEVKGLEETEQSVLEQGVLDIEQSRLAFWKRGRIIGEFDGRIGSLGQQDAAGDRTEERLADLDAGVIGYDVEVRVAGLLPDGMILQART